MTKIRHNLYVGGCVSADNLELLRSRGITAILNVAKDHNGKWRGFNVVKVGLTDDARNPPHMIRMAISVLGSLLDAGETVFVHCVAGSSRSPYVVARALAKRETMPFQLAWEHVSRLHPGTCGWSPLANGDVVLW